MKVTDQIEFKALNKKIDQIRDFRDRHDWIEYFVAPLIVVIILLSVYIIKGVYPFGKNTIAYYDMPTQYVPFYSYAWDFIHGKGGLYLNWYLGLGISMAGAVGNYVLFPTNVFLLFTQRENIVYALSFLLLIQIVLSALSMSFYSKYKFNNSIWTICSGILYACCGYVIQYYTNIFFLDYVILLPFIIWSLEQLMFKYKYLPFIVFFFLACIPSFQFTAMLVIYLIFKVYFMLPFVEKNKQGYVLRLFAFSGIIAVLLSMIILLPAVVVTLRSSRMDLNSGFNYLNTLRTVFSQFRKEKYFMMYCSEIAVGLFALIILRGKYVINKYYNNIIMILIVGLPILVEGINILWHFGSYKHFPIRFGYMISFETLTFVGCYLADEKKVCNRIVDKIAGILCISVLPFIAYVLFLFFKQFLKNGVSNLSPYESYDIYFLSLSIIYFIVFLVDSKSVRNTALLLLAIIQAFCGCYGLIAPEVGFADGSRVKYLTKELEARELFENNISNLNERVKCDPTYYEPNYGLIVGQPSIGAWIYGLPEDTETVLHNKLGYHGVQSSLIDGGGTVFSDALLGVSKILTDSDDEDFYIKKINEGLFEYDNKLPFGIVSASKDISISNRMLDYHNALFRKLTGIEEDLIRKNKAEKYVVETNELDDKSAEKIKDGFVANFPISVSESNDDETAVVESETALNGSENDTSENNESSDAPKNKEYVLSIPTTGREYVYMDLDEGFEGELAIVVNGEYKYFSSYMTENSNMYPNMVYNGIVLLGSANDEALEVKIYTVDNEIDGVNIGILNLDTMNKGIEKIKTNQDLSVSCGKNGMRVVGHVNKDGTLFFPVSYSDDWHVKVNGRKVNVKPFIDNAFIAVEVEQGDVDIDFYYIPKGLMLGLGLTVLGVLGFIIMIVVIRKGIRMDEKKLAFIDSISIYGFKAIAVSLLILMYIIPVCVKMSL